MLQALSGMGLKSILHFFTRISVLGQVEFIKKAQSLGFTLEEIKQILDVRDRGEKPCSLVQSLLNPRLL